MDTLLIAVTVISLIVALGMAYGLARLVREERRRSDARVAALTDMSAESVTVPAAAAAHGLLPESRAISAGDVQIRPTATSRPVVGELFVDPERPSPWRRRLAIIGSLATITVVTGAVAVSRSHDPSPAPAATLGAPDAHAAPLELLSLRYAQQADKMTITGLVENPRAGGVLSQVTVTAFLFGADGTFLASGRAPLDFTTLAPGDESPFVVSVPVSGAVARYRVGFRGADGRVIAHVDRRAVGTLAERNPGPS
jgi:hypothetical protein